MVDHRPLMPVLFTIDLCQWFLFSLQFLFPTAVFAPANAYSLLTPCKGFRPHNTKQISIAAY